MSRILVPVEILEGETIDPGLLSLFAGDDIVLLGYHEIPEQTATEQARESFADRAQDKLADIVSAIAEVSTSVTERLVFTHDIEQTKRRVAEETDCDAILRLGSAMTMDTILVVLHPEASATHIAEFAADHIGATDREVVLLSLTEDETVSRESLETAERILSDAGITGSSVSVEKAVTDSPLERIVDAAVGSDLVVIGAQAPTAMDIVFGDFVERIATETVGPVAVVRTQVAEEADVTGETGENGGGDASSGHSS